MAFVLYRSSAGSGKTYTLVKEYLKLALENPEKFKHTLAITFTNKAAGEMKERILQALKDLAKGEDKILADTLVSESPQLRHIDKISSNVLTTVLHNYSDFAIMTIDSFIHKVIKGFALEIGLPLNFGIDLNYEKIQTYVIEQLLAAVGKDEYITDIILRFVFDRVQEEKSWNIEADMRRFEKQLFSEKNIDWVRGVSSAFHHQAFYEYMEQLKEIRGRFVVKMNDWGEQALGMIQAAGLTIDDFAYKDKGAAGFLRKLAKLRPGDLKQLTMSVRFREEQWSAKSTPGEINAAIDHLLETGLSEIHHNIIRHFEDKRSEALSAAFVLDNVYLSAIINRMTALIDKYKKENNVIPISEFNVKVNEIVRNSPVPFIYAVIGEKFNHYLVDEFQDTSRLQWENLYPLIENAMGSDFFNLAVGDGKQSIYRWRGGDMEIMEKDIKQRIQPGQLQIKALDKNYRSRQNILDFNNRFFEKLSDYYKEKSPFLAEVYSGVSQGPVQKKGGFVSLQFIEGSPDDTETETDDAGDLTVFQKVKKIIDDCIDRGFGYGDIAILVRENRKGQMVAEYLLEQDIHVVSPDSLALARAPMIRFLIDILLYLTNPADKITEAAIIFFITQNRKESPQDSSEVANRFMDKTQWDVSPEISEFFHRRNYLIRMPVYEVIEEVIRVFNLAESLDFETTGYLQAFLDIVSGYTAENSVDFASFLDWWEYSKDDFSVNVPESKPAVKIMSIHKAKGLEFPVVIVPFADWEHKVDKQLWLFSKPPIPTQPPLNIPMPVNTTKALEDTYFNEEYSKEKERVTIDNINLLYVAFTRAEDHLYIISRKKKNNENYEQLNQLAVPLMKPSEEGEDRYIYGEPVKVSKDDAVEEAGDIRYEETGRLVSSKWYNRITIRRKSAEFWKFDDSYRRSPRTMGILIHHILSGIHGVEDVSAAVNNVLNAGEIDVSEKEDLERKIREIFGIEAVRFWFNPGPGARVFTEFSIITDEGILRPDRVIVTGDKIVIVDFKTGAPNDADERQALKYKEAIQAMGYSDITAHLFYLQTLKIVEVTQNQ